MPSVWNEIDEKHRKAQREQEQAKLEIESAPGWRFKGWQSRNIPGGVVWVATCGRRGIEIEKPTISELVAAVKAKQQDIADAERQRA